MDRDFEGKTVLVTGSGRNLGRATILEFAARGANVVVNARSNREQAEEVAGLARAAGAEALVVIGDVGDPETIAGWEQEIASRFGRVDILVSNAAVRAFQDFFETSIEDWRYYINLNLSASFYLAKAFVPAMRDAGWGRIILVSGVDGFMGFSHRPHNVTAKAGLHGLTKALAVELARFGITANTLGTGGFNVIRDPTTHPPDMGERFYRRTPDRLTDAAGEPEEFAHAVAFLASPRSRYITGTVLHVNGGQYMV